jgi:hypothetical protein
VGSNPAGRIGKTPGPQPRGFFNQAGTDSCPRFEPREASRRPRSGRRRLSIAQRAQVNPTETSEDAAAGTTPRQLVATRIWKPHGAEGSGARGIYRRRLKDEKARDSTTVRIRLPMMEM